MKKGLIVSALSLVLLLTLMSNVTSATYTHEDLTLTVLVNGHDVSLNNVKSNPLVIDLSQPIEIELLMSNAGETVHLTDAAVTFYTLQTILFWQLETKIYTHQVDLDNNDDDGDGKQGFDIPAGTNESDSFVISPEDIADYHDALSGRNVRLDILFNFENIPDYTIKVYLTFV
ncbi:MAG: hypothetical protein ACFFCD_14385 [Promethearchaeota archaeon]